MHLNRVEPGFIYGANGVLLPLLELLFKGPGCGRRAGGNRERLRAESSTLGILNTSSTVKKLSLTLFSEMSPPPPSLSTNSFPSSIFLSSFHNSLQSSQFPSAPYMPFTCVSVVAGVSECTCVLLCLMHNRVVVVCMSSDIVGLSQVSANIKSCFGGLVVTPTKSFFQLLVFSGGEL